MLMRSAALRLRATWVGLRRYTLRYLLFSAASLLALTSVIIANSLASLNQGYAGGLLRVPVNYGVISVNNASLPFYITNAAYAKAYGLSIRGNECIILGELPNALVKWINETLGCSAITGYPTINYPIVIKFTSLNVANGTLIIPRDPTSYFSSILFMNIFNFTLLLHMVLLIVVALSSIYVNLGYLSYLTDSFRRLRLLTNGGLSLAMAYITLLIIASYVAIAGVEYAVVKALTTQAPIKLNSGLSIAIVEPPVILLAPALTTLVVSWRRSSR